MRYLQALGIDTLVVHQAELSEANRERLLRELDASPLLRQRAIVEGVVVYSVLPDAALGDLDGSGAGRSRILVSADERVPGVLALTLIRRWRETGHRLFGPGRVRYYGPLTAPTAGQVFDYGLLAAGEDPLIHGFSTDGLPWRTNGLSLYRGDPRLRANLSLEQPAPGNFHPRYPATLDLNLDPSQLRIGESVVTWDQPLTEAVLELDVASLTDQTLSVGATSVSIEAGVTTVLLPAPLGRPLQVRVQSDQTAFQRLRVRSATPPAAPAQLERGKLVATATAQFDG